MRVDVITDRSRLMELRDNWNEVYAADPDAQFFLSWTWMLAWLGDIEREAFVLAAHTDGAYRAFLPITSYAVPAKDGGCHSVFEIAGQGVGDYGGLLCHPAHEAEAIEALFGQIRQMGWRQFVLKAFRASDERLRAALKCFPRGKFTSKDFDDIYPDGTDHSIFPGIDLPDDWDDFLAASLSSDSRRKVRRFLRQVEQSDEFRITETTQDTLERDLKVLFDLWSTKWGSDRMGPYLKAHADMFRHCQGEGVLYMTVLWSEDRPIGALANLLDETKKVMLFKIMGRDLAFKNPSPNFVLYAHAIRHAIALGYKSCDFLQGNHRFKYSFGAVDRKTHNVEITRRRDRAAGPLLDRADVAQALHHNVALHRQGRLKEAERGYRQILRLDPLSQPAAAGLKRIEAAKKAPPAKKR